MVQGSKLLGLQGLRIRRLEHVWGEGLRVFWVWLGPPNPVPRHFTPETVRAAAEHYPGIYKTL